MHLRYLLSLSIAALVVTLFSGCGGQAVYTVDGKIEFTDGQPVKFGTIEFLNRETLLNARGKINRDGTFTVSTFSGNDGAVPGEHEITIQQFVTVPLLETQDIKIKHDHGKLVSHDYRSYKQSDLRVTIEEKSPNEIKLIVREHKE